MSQRLRTFLEPGFEQQLFHAATANLAERQNPLRLNNYAYAVRELVRHVLHRLAPEDLVRQCSWYKCESNRAGSVTRKQRAQYAIHGGLPEEYVRDTLRINIDSAKTALANAIDALSRLTHIEEAVFALPPNRVDEHVRETDAALDALCETIDSCRTELLAALSERIDRAVVDATLSETILAVDELATHHFIDEVYVEDVEVTDISARTIQIQVSGLIEVSLQWGSNSDVARGDGLQLGTAFPFNCELSCAVENPEHIEAHEETLIVDTSSWKMGRD